MRQELLDILTAARRRLLWARAVESAAVAATAGALAAAAVELAWVLRLDWPLLAIVLSLLPVAAGTLAVCAKGVRKALALDERLMRLSAGVAAVVGLAGAAAIGLHLGGELPQGWWGAAGVALGATAGMAGVLMRGLSLADVAIYLDTRCRLGDRLATAVELSRGSEADGGFAHCVYDQALAAAKAANVTRLGLWRRTSATAGAAGLAALLCLTLAMLPTPQTPAQREIAAMADNLTRLTPEQRQELSKALNAAATQPGDAKTLQILKLAGRAVDDVDPAALKKALELLEKAGYHLTQIDAASSGDGGKNGKTLATLLGKPTPGAQPSPSAAPVSPSPTGHPTVEPTPAVPATPPPKPTPTPPAVTPAPTPPAYVNVMNPNYRPAATAPAGAANAAAPRLVLWEDAWQIARSQAADALSSGRVPPQYRQLVRDFFADSGR